MINCVVCGKPLQMVFAGISEPFAGGVFLDKDGMGRWMVCTNPDCPDGKMNIGQREEEIEL